MKRKKIYKKMFQKNLNLKNASVKKIYHKKKFN